jgi:hypothetical protein
MDAIDASFSAVDTFAADASVPLMDDENVAKADLQEMDLLDNMGIDESIPPVSVTPLETSSEEEQFLSATFQNTSPSERPAGMFGLELPTGELLEVPVPDTLAGEVPLDLVETVLLDDALSSSSWQTESAVPTQDPWSAPEALPGEEPPAPDVDMSMFETKPTSDVDMSMFETTTTETTMVEEASGTTETSSASGGTSESFEDAFAALKEEIELNPQGERIDDVLKMEQLQDQVAKIEFNIPQHEHALARGIPLYALPDASSGRGAADAAKTLRAAPSLGSADASVESMRRMVEENSTSQAAMSSVKTTVTTKTTTAIKTDTVSVAGVDLSGSLLDEATKARLSQVLDEIISVSVRKAVREEMPRLMERIAKETGPSASA